MMTDIFKKCQNLIFSKETLKKIQKKRKRFNFY